MRMGISIPDQDISALSTKIPEKYGPFVEVWKVKFLRNYFVQLYYEYVQFLNLSSKHLHSEDFYSHSLFYIITIPKIRIFISDQVTKNISEMLDCYIVSM